MPQISNKLNSLTVEEMVENLSGLPESVFGYYAFSRDILKSKISKSEQQGYIENSIEAGKKAAEKLLAFQPEFNYDHFIKTNELEVATMTDEQVGSQVMFALYTQPNLIQISKRPIEKVAAFQLPHLSEEEVYRLILGHEIYHYLETHDDESYTQNTKLTLWKFLGFKYKSQIRSTSEIAAMSFTKTLNHFTYSPFVLDFLLLYAYNKEEGLKIYEEMMALKNV